MVQSPLLRLLCGLCCSSAVFVSAAPALVWSSAGSVVGSHSRESTGSIYTSEEIAAASLFDNNGDAANLQVVFVLGRGSDGTESLTRMAPFLSGIAQRSPAHYVHSHVTGVESVEALKRTVSKSSQMDQNAAVSVVGLNELGMKFNASESDRRDKATKKSREISAANVLLVDVSAETSPEVLDDAVRQALVRADRVVLTAIRSIDEVKEERAKIVRRRLEMQYQAGAHIGYDGRNRHRRLENNNNNNNNNQQQQQQQANDQAGVYFVQMTPNILSGILFFFLFATIAAIGISCMGMIASNDTYVKKMPAVGREA